MKIRPDWFDLPPEQWPDDAREFYRLVYVGLRRAQETGREADGKHGDDSKVPKQRAGTKPA